MAGFRWLRGLSKAIGIGGAASVLIRRALRLKRRITVRSAFGPISLRPCDSDFLVAAQVFGDLDYDLGSDIVAALRRLAQTWRAEGVTPLIIDAGANVGYSSRLFAQIYPEADIVAIEVDAETAEMLRYNTSDLARVHVVQAALWRHEDGVNLLRVDGDSWANAVEDAGSVPSTTLDALLRRMPNSRILLLKLDIEGAERDAVAASEGIIREIPCIIAEPHDWMIPGHGSLTPLIHALAGVERDTILKGENIAFIDSSLRVAPVPAPTPAAGRPLEPVSGG